MAKPKSRAHIMNLEAINAMVENASALIDQVVLICCLFCGMRVGEVAHMKRSWWDGSHIRIPAKEPCLCYDCNLEVRNAKGKRGVWTAKTDRAERIIPVKPKYLPHLNSFFKQNAKIGISRIRIYQRLRALGKKAGIKTSVFPHAMRATYITDLIEHGVDLWVVQALVGHSSLRTTEEYVRLRPGAVESELKKKGVF